MVIFLIFSLIIAAVSIRADDHYCQQRLSLSPIMLNTTLAELRSATGQIQPISPPICLANNLELYPFLVSLQETLIGSYPALMDFYALYDGTPETGFSLELRVTFWRVTNDQLPGAIRWQSNSTSPVEKASWRGNCWQGSDAPTEGVLEEIFSPGEGPDTDDPILEPDFQPSSAERFLAFRQVLPVNNFMWH